MPVESDQKKRGLIERVTDLFMREGMSAQTMEGIADNVGISKRTLYKYFPNKEKLIDLVIQHKLETVESEILKLMASDRPYLERLVGFFVIVERAIKPMANKLIADVSKNMPWVWPKIDEFRHNRILVHLEALLKEGAEKGYLRSDLDLKIISPLYIGIIEQVGRPEFMSKLPIPPHQLVSSIIKIVLGGILNENGRARLATVEKELSIHA